MKIVSVLGSPKKNGNTASLLQAYLQGVREKNKSAEITQIILASQKIVMCKGCNSCKNGNAACIIKDDMDKNYALVRAADVLIMATPVYVFNMTAQLKAFLDRLYALNGDELFGKQIVLLTTYGATDEEEAGVGSIVQTIKMIAHMLNMNFKHNINVSTANQEILENQAALHKAFCLGLAL
ncbi:flavodoxin family protein|uniref:Multimeric flavodoxin WrbA n=1 Tax=Dendrosporobacter quercicolus TaxID=146817 RepID=A0A1G9NRB6_9FIRM|nr:flavodoxin family protein [Dendrosporobacter quercicolus]NSL47424.1 flavodoxin family protein [Dendrosporobacter quercicolus DSM 1736]SDL88843.1 Multimeric flavodoxin WrbA [Dendrosporobacter quercicolus]